MNFFSRNLDSRGRLVRGVGAAILLMVGVGLALTVEPWWPAALTFAAGAFVLFEALRGWCVMRACGIKTRL